MVIVAVETIQGEFRAIAFVRFGKPFQIEMVEKRFRTIMSNIRQEKGVVIRDVINSRNVLLRFAVYYAVIMIIVIFGAYGIGYIPVNPIYANF